MKTSFRRSVLDDLAALQDLWMAAGLSGRQLEAHFAEFQVAEREGRIDAAVGITVEGRDALLHHAGFRDDSARQDLVAPLWNRILQVAGNHGTCRIWTTDPTFPVDQRFVEPGPDLDSRRPQTLTSEGTWRVLVLKEEVERLIPAEDQLFEIFQQSEVEKRERMLGTAKILKVFATLFLLFVIVMGILFGSTVIKKHQRVKETQGTPVITEPLAPSGNGQQ